MSRPAALCVGIIAGLLALHAAVWRPTEPFFNGDETRHVMTGVFVRDAIRDGGYRHPRAYAERYYAQYPALGLVVWPPGFYAVSGSFMLFGADPFATARVTVLAYYALACGYLFALVRRTHGVPTAAVALLLFALGREVTFHARAAMLELPLAACAFAALFHLERYLAENRRRDLILIGLWTVAAGCHRYDAVFLLPVFAIRLLIARQLRAIVRRDVLLTATATAVLLAPVYYLAVAEIGGTHADSVAGEPFGWRNVEYYPKWLHLQLGSAQLTAGLVGLTLSFRAPLKSQPYWALLAGVYLFYTPLSELESRHSLPWLAAWAVFAADAVLAPKPRWAKVGLASAAIAGTAHWTYLQPVLEVHGYRDAAEFVLRNSTGPTDVLFDGLFDGTFVYEMRDCDPHRRVWVLRGDKLLYAVRSDPNVGYVEWAADDAAVLKALTDTGPEFIVTEDPPAKFVLPGAVRLRKVLNDHPELFRRGAEVPLRNVNVELLDGVKLTVWRNLKPRPDRPAVRVKMFWQGTELKAER